MWCPISNQKVDFISNASVTSAGSLRSLVAVLSGEAAWAVDDRVAGKMAAAADMWELAGGRRTSRSTVEPKTDSSILGLLAGRVGTGAIRLAVVWTGANNTVWLS